MVSEEERKLWATLIHAEMVASANLDAGSSETLFLYEDVAIRVRTELRDKFGVNLDDLGAFAETQTEMMAENIRLERMEKERVRQAGIRAAMEARKLLGR